MSNKPNDLSEEMYHRLYRLIKRKIDPRSIAATLNIPLRTVLNVISRIDNISAVETEPSGSTETDASQAESDFLDIYVYQRTRYVIVRLVGSLVESRSDSLNKELGKILETSFKAVALKITDVRQIDEQGKDCLLQLKKRFSSAGKFLAILDPSPEIESLLVHYDIESQIPVFGTERAFEDSAFAKSSPTISKRIQQ